MTKSLYEDAVADAKRLRELAEQTAKNRLVEAIMPQIRDMVNRKILGEELSMEEIDDLETMVDEIPSDPEPEIPLAPPADSEESLNGDVSGNIINIDAAGDVNIELETEEADDAILTDTMAEALLKLLGSEDGTKLSESLARLENTFGKLKNLVETVKNEKLTTDQTLRLNKSFAKCVKEAHKLQKQLILNEQATQEDLEHRLTIIIKEMRNMSKSNSRNIFDFLFEAKEVEEMKKTEAEKKDLDEAELSLELSDEEREELAGAGDAEAIDVALEDILGDIEVAMVEPEGGVEGGEEAADADEEEEEGEDEGIELPEADHNEADMDEAVYEIDESALRRELARLTEEAADEADQFGGGEIPHGDVFVDVDEEDLINALADELGSVSDAPAVAAESRRRRPAATSRQLREAKRQIAVQNSTITELKKQLVEMNLFNAKLLYANKLMQNKNLTMNQQRSIVEALDNAKTLREAKLLFKSLSTSLVKKRTGKKLNENALRAAGSSRTTKSAQPSNESNPEAARWAVLAGI